MKDNAPFTRHNANTCYRVPRYDNFRETAVLDAVYPDNDHALIVERSIQTSGGHNGDGQRSYPEYEHRQAARRFRTEFADGVAGQDQYWHDQKRTHCEK